MSNKLTVLMFQGRDWLQGQCRRSTLPSLVKDQMQSECVWVDTPEIREGEGRGGAKEPDGFGSGHVVRPHL